MSRKAITINWCLRFVSNQSNQVRKDEEQFRGSEELLSLVRSSIAEATMVNETNEQVA